MTKEFLIADCELPVDINSLPILSVVDFTLESANEFKNSMFELEAHPYYEHILVNISSFGGSAHALLIYMNTIQNCRKEVILSVSGYAASAGAFLLASGTKGNRFMEPNSRLFIHSIQGYSGGGSLEFLDSELDCYKSLDQEIFKVISKQSNLTVKEIKQELKERSGNWELSPKEAIEYGFADHIGTPHFSKSVQTTLTID